VNEPGWQAALADQLAAPWLQELDGQIAAERASGVVIHPPQEQVYRAFELTPYDQVRVVIVGQDPYHGPGQATGLAFSVPRGARVPPSLRNIYTELGTDLQVPRPTHGDLASWADQGVLLLNTTLTVREGAAGSHAGRGWERFTDAALNALATRRERLVFLLWGRHAQAKASLVDAARHLVLQAPHPSPLSASRGFLGCRHFSQANAYLRDHAGSEIDWKIPE
jgi:uracil-DNA glycosylase